MPEVRARLRIHGRVQGVFYRGSARREALRLGLTGSAENRLDGTVEIVAEGDEAAVEKLIAWCRVGPPHASVTRVVVERGAATGELSGFAVH